MNSRHCDELRLKHNLGKEKEVLRYGAIALEQKRQHIMGERRGERERKAWVKC
jgi:hypothetical protein